MTQINIEKKIKEISYHEFLSNNIYNGNTYIKTPFNKNVKLLPCDLTSSSFPLKIVEKYLETHIYKYYTNTHSNNMMGQLMDNFIEQTKRQIILSVGGSCSNDKIIFDGFGVSGCVGHLIHLIKPNLVNSIIFVSIYEHYSNYLPWLHNATKLIIMDVNNIGLIDLEKFEQNLQNYSNSFENIYVSVSACSNVTGIILIENIYGLSEITHKYKGKIFVDYATAAPYLPINMHYNNEKKIYFDAIFISPHKFPGGQSTPGIMVVNKNIISNSISYTPSGGTVRFCSKKHKPIYSENIEVKENGGTPNIIGIIKCCLIFQIKDHFFEQIINHEIKLTNFFHKCLLKLKKKNPNLIILNSQNNMYRLPIFPIQILPYHYNFIVVLLCDLFGIMTRGGISCSSVLAETLLNLSDTKLCDIEKCILQNNGVPTNYGWIRITLSNTHTNDDILFIISAIDYLCNNAHLYDKKYKYCQDKNNFIYNN